jgi:hypothetical protein
MPTTLPRTFTGASSNRWRSPRILKVSGSGFELDNVAKSSCARFTRFFVNHCMRKTRASSRRLCSKPPDGSLRGDRRAQNGISQQDMIRKLKSGQFRLYSRKKNAETGKRRNLGTFATLEQAKQHEREVQYFKKH